MGIITIATSTGAICFKDSWGMKKIPYIYPRDIEGVFSGISHRGLNLGVPKIGGWMVGGWLPPENYIHGSPENGAPP